MFDKPRTEEQRRRTDAAAWAVAQAMSTPHFETKVVPFMTGYEVAALMEVMRAFEMYEAAGALDSAHATSLHPDAGPEVAVRDLERSPAWAIGRIATTA